MFISRHSRSSGVTILDLLVVIAILIILAGVAIVAGNSARMRAYNTQALVCGEQIRKAQTLYYSEQQTFADAFSKLNAQMVARCALVSVVEVSATPQGYTYTVAHQRGNTKYTIEDDRASSTTLAGGAENAAGAGDTSGGGTLIGEPLPMDPSGGGLIVRLTDVPQFTLDALDDQLVLTVTDASGRKRSTTSTSRSPRGFYSGGSNISATYQLTNLPPGAYTVTVTTPLCIASPVTSVTACPASRGGRLTYQRAITIYPNYDANFSLQNVWPKWYTTWNYHLIAATGSGTTGATRATQQGMDYVHTYLAWNVNDASRTDCAAKCWETAPTEWKVQPSASGVPVYHAGTNPDATHTGNALYGTIAIATSGTASAAPLDLTGTSLPAVTTFLPGEAGHVTVRSTPTEPLTVVVTKVPKDNYCTAMNIYTACTNTGLLVE